MYKKIILIFVLLCSLLGCSAPNINEVQNETKENKTTIKSVFMTYYELSGFTVNKSQDEFTNKMKQSLKELSNNGFNRITVQVRPCADAFYKSSYFPTSEYCVGEQGRELAYDPLSIMVELAHKNNLSIEAWVNPYRVCQTNDFSKLCDSNIALKWKDSDKVIALDNGIYFNPASSEVIDLIVNGVKELATNYDIDSICFDDYFYPTKNKKIDKAYYKKYKNNGGNKSLAEWRRDNVSNMISSVYSAIKKINSNITFGISPASNIENDYSSLYADVIKWSNNDGYVDYICPQIYFGFRNENQPFMKTTKRWCEEAGCDLMVALPLYKAGEEDKYAGSGKNEFVKNSDIISRQVKYLSKLDRVSGYYVFSYSFLNNNSETMALYSAMQNS